MVDEFTVRTRNINLILGTLEKQRKKLTPKSPALKRAMDRASLLLINQAKLNIRRHGLIDTGRLLNSMRATRFEFFQSNDTEIGIRVGSFGVPYAAVWEGLLGRNISIRAHARTITKAFGKDIPPKTVAIGRHVRTITPKPFLRPAYQTHKHRIIDIIQKALIE